jgi:hypothetical protein
VFLTDLETISERYCFDPPTPAFNGGKYNWNTALYNGSRTPYYTDVIYSCDIGRKLFQYTPNNTIEYDSKTLSCQWDQTWAPDEPVS